MRMIDADALIKTLETTSIFPTPAWLRAVIIDAPTIDPQRKRGKWIKHIDDLFPAESTLECNVCHHEQPITIDDNFCPNCGADMREDGEADG